MILRIRSLVPLAIVASLILTALPALAEEERHLEYRAGYFSPWDGDEGFSVSMAIMLPINEESQWGIEAEVRRFKTEYFGVDGVQTNALHIRGLYRYDLDFDNDWPVIPYAGIGVGISMNAIDNDEIEDELEEDPTVSASVASVGFGGGVIGLVGVETDMPGDDRFKAFVEGRADYSVQATRKEEAGSGKKTRTENLGGGSIFVGFRMVF